MKKMSNCGCDNPKYSAGWCYGMWSGIGCYMRGKHGGWDLDADGKPYNIPEKLCPECGERIYTECFACH